MGLFSKESCTFCNAEVGALKRSKLATKEFICNDCKRKTNFFARMDYTSREDAQRMMDTLGQEEEAFQESFEKAEGRFARAEASFNTWDLGSERVHYRCNTTTGGFQLKVDGITRYEHIPVFWYANVMPYEFSSAGDMFEDMNRAKMRNKEAEYVKVEKTRGEGGKVEKCLLTIPYNDANIREIRIDADVKGMDDVKAFEDLAERMNSDRKVWISKTIHTEQQKNIMQVRNLSDTAMGALKAAVTGGDVKEVAKKAMETANEIEEGKVKRGFFGKLHKK